MNQRCESVGVGTRRAGPCLVALVLLFVGGQATGFAARYPTSRGWVNDFAGVMDSRDVERLTTALSGFEQRTGIEVAVVTLPSVPEGDIERAAADLFKEWGIGKRGQDNGALILCSVADRRIRIEVGYGLEHALTDAKSGRLIDEIILPRFRAGDLSGGLVAGGTKLIELLGAPASAHPAPLSPPDEPSPLTIPFEWLVILLIAGVWIYVVRGFWRSRAGGKVSDYWYGGWSGGDFGGGFGGGSSGGFGGGSSGGGGASRGW
ncbi:MAG: TPM domain-containing protein [Candidatus Omnitrophota bacterium]|nr:TPM domain-containing protein [Candidatus Omnitrophota bacterium]